MRKKVVVSKRIALKDLVRQKGITQASLAKRMALDPSAVTLLLQGKRKLQLDEAGLLSDALSVPIGDVLVAAGVNAAVPKSAGILYEAVRNLIRHATAHAMECTQSGDIQTAKDVLADVNQALTLLKNLEGT